MPTQLERTPAITNRFYDKGRPSNDLMDPTLPALAAQATSELLLTQPDLVTNRKPLEAAIPTFLTTLTQQLRTLRTGIESAKIGSKRTAGELFSLVNEASAAHDVSLLHPVGFDTEPSWIVEMLRGRPMKIEVARLPLTSGKNGFGDEGLDYVGLQIDQMYPGAIVNALETVLPEPSPKIVVVDDYRDIEKNFITGEIGEVRELTTQPQRDMAAVHAEKGMRKYRVIDEAAIAGVDYTVVRTSDQIERAQELIDTLVSSGKGEVVEEDNKLIYRPSRSFVRSLVVSPEQERRLQNEGITLQEAEYPSNHLLQAATYRDDGRMHVSLVDENDRSIYEDARVLLRASGIITEDYQYNIVTYRSENNYLEYPPYITLSGIRILTQKISSDLEL